MNDNMQNVPTYGDIFTSMEYDKRLERRSWLKRNKARILAGCAGCLVSLIVITALLLML